ncbi:MAG: YbhB/YbcL family Raf kinase inhibitor-like protein [Phycisphaerales bacterium]|nr:YbhB/YbcL family Raf kinase inhibitor-like protein [Phycisphaerales bacterium]
MSITVTSTAFADGEPIPAKYTADGDDISPPIEWSAGPAETQSYALIMDDPDAPAGTWVHWVVWDITETHLAERATGLRVGRNSWRRSEYGGPAPPSGTHRYFFKVYALDATLTLDTTCAKQDLLDAMKGHILAEGQLMGTYAR